MHHELQYGLFLISLFHENYYCLETGLTDWLNLKLFCCGEHPILSYDFAKMFQSVIFRSLMLINTEKLFSFQSESYDTLLGFNMESYRSSKMLWKACVEHHTFFRLHSPRVKRKFPLSLGSKFTYSGRTEYQTVSEVKQRGILERKFVRSPSKQLVSKIFHYCEAYIPSQKSCLHIDFVKSN